MLKYFARRGQCFTTTKYITEIKKSEITVIDDICCVKPPSDGGEAGELYTFSDGCGNISLPLAAMID